MNERLKDSARLLKSKAYILVTDKEASMSGNFEGFDGFMRLHTLKLLHAKTEDMIKAISDDMKARKPKRSTRSGTAPKKATKTAKTTTRTK